MVKFIRIQFHDLLESRLTEFVPGYYITALDVLICRFNSQVLYQIVRRYKIVINGHFDLQFMNLADNWHQLCCTAGRQ